MVHQNETTPTSTRAQSEIIGVVILLSLSFVAIGMLFAATQPILSDSTDNVDFDRAQNEFTRMSSSLATSALGPTETKSVTLNVGNGELTSNPEAAYVNVTQRFAPGTGETNQTIYEGQIGNVRYQQDGNVLAYEAGGIWRKDVGANQSVMVTPPQFNYEERTLSFPMFNVTNQVRTTGGRYDLQVDTQEVVEQQIENPLENGSIYVEVESDFYMAWVDYFRSRTDSSVIEIDHAENVAEIKLVIPEPPKKIDDAAGGNEVTGKADDFFDSYQEDVSYPSADNWIYSMVDYAKTHGDDWGSASEPYDNQTYYSDDAATLDGDFDISSNNVTVVVDGPASLDQVDVTAASNNSTRLDFVVTDDLTITSGSSSNMAPTSGNHTNLATFVSSDGEVHNTGQFDGYNGLLYAPASHCHFSGSPNSESEGSVICDVIQVSGNPGEWNHGGDMDINVQQANDTVTFLHVTENKLRLE